MISFSIDTDGTKQQLHQPVVKIGPAARFVLCGHGGSQMANRSQHSEDTIFHQGHEGALHTIARASACVCFRNFVKTKKRCLIKLPNPIDLAPIVDILGIYTAGDDAFNV